MSSALLSVYNLDIDFINLVLFFAILYCFLYFVILVLLRQCVDIIQVITY